MKTIFFTLPSSVISGTVRQRLRRLYRSAWPRPPLKCNTGKRPVISTPLWLTMSWTTRTSSSVSSCCPSSNKRRRLLPLPKGEYYGDSSLVKKPAALRSTDFLKYITIMVFHLKVPEKSFRDFSFKDKVQVRSSTQSKEHLLQTSSIIAMLCHFVSAQVFVTNQQLCSISHRVVGLRSPVVSLLLAFAVITVTRLHHVHWPSTLCLWGELTGVLQGHSLGPVLTLGG